MGKSVLVILGALLLLGLFLGIWALGGYNSLIEKRNTVDNRWAQVENNLQRRADLIPNLANTVKGVARLEESIYTKIAEARSKILSPTATPEEKIEANNQMTQAARDAGLLPAGAGGILGTGGRFLAITEQYPQLKSDQSFLRLQDELAGTENRLAVSRKDYNDAVADYATTKQRFPTMIMANLMKGTFPDKPFFKAEEGSRRAPTVDFGR
ncbi:MAG TPA: LemA family protein [Blastocatellia bacterium]|nr:LemA family protein [Blastocatellia bacterium]